MRIHAIILAVCLAVTAAVAADDNKLPVHFTGMPGAEPAAPALKMTAK